MPETTSAGWTIYYETLGDRSNPPIVMVLGLSHRLAHWGRLPALLAKELFVVTFDCRGMGQSERRDEPFSVADEVGDIAAVMSAAGVDRPALYGRSRGGMLAQQFALSMPDRVGALILSGTSHRGPTAVGSTGAVTRAMNFTPDMTREQIFETQNIAMAAPGWRERDPQAFAALLATDLEAPPRRFAVSHQQKAIATWSSFEDLAEITAPTLVICGADDGMVPPENSRQIAEGIPGARFELIPQCGHLPMLEQPEAVARLVLEFMRGTS